MNKMSIPMTREDFLSMGRVHETWIRVEGPDGPIGWFGPRPVRIEYPWRGRTYTEWYEESRVGWSILCDYGRPQGRGSVVAALRTEERCQAYLTRTVLLDPYKYLVAHPITVIDWK